jgi:sterol desaturase/sphingolipid hydroxylase (fatty acid hydroxylase superfamily)
MNIKSTPTKKFTQPSSQMKCVLVFLAIMATYIASTYILSSHGWIAGCIYFIGGWITWTFIEYLTHRFWMHDTPIDVAKPVAEYHMLHHRNPTEMDITKTHRFLVWGLVVIVIGISIWLSLYLLAIAGFVFGFSCYCTMHWVLHQSWSIKLFPTLHRFHLYHHCKYPNSCYGVTVHWWDLVFKTTPPEEPVLLKRVTDFYFGKPRQRS